MAHSSSDTAFATIEKSFTYRGAREHWSNSYHFDQVPPTSTVWDTLTATIWALEAQCFPADVQVERMLGHEPGTPPVLVFEADPAPPGEGGPAGTWAPGVNDWPPSGDVAAWIRWGTTQKTSLGKPIYLRNYYHAIWAAGTHDTITTTQKAKLDALGLQLLNGIIVSGVTYRRAGPRGAVAQNHVTGNYLTTRTLKHRGKRKRALPAGSTVQLPPIIID